MIMRFINTFVNNHSYLWLYVVPITYVCFVRSSTVTEAPSCISYFVSPVMYIILYVALWCLESRATRIPRLCFNVCVWRFFCFFFTRIYPHHHRPLSFVIIWPNAYIYACFSSCWTLLRFTSVSLSPSDSLVFWIVAVFFLSLSLSAFSFLPFSSLFRSICCKSIVWNFVLL